MLKTTSLGGAIRYTLGIWDRLTPFLDNPEIWLDNNPTDAGFAVPYSAGATTWIEVGARHRGRGDSLQPGGIGQGVRHRSDRVSDRGRDPRQGHRAPCCYPPISRSAKAAP